MSATFYIVCFICTGLFCLDAILSRRDRKSAERRIKAWARWRIRQVGVIIETEDGAFPSGWVMESVPGVPLIKHVGNGQVLIGGYTISELREMTVRPSEFET